MESEKVFLSAVAVVITLVMLGYALFHENSSFYVLYIVGRDGTFESLRKDVRVREPYYFRVFIGNKLGWKEEFKIEVFVHDELVVSARRTLDNGDGEFVYFAIQFKDPGPCWVHVVCTPASDPSLRKKLSVKINVKS